MDDEALFIDRKFNIFGTGVKVPSSLNFSLMDGELNNEKKTNGDTVISFVVFDFLIVCGSSVMKNNHSQRMTIGNDGVLNHIRDKFNEVNSINIRLQKFDWELFNSSQMALFLCLKLFHTNLAIVIKS